MAITQREAPTTITALDHVFAATADTAVTSIHMCNITSSDAVVNIYLLPNDGSTAGATENNKIYNSLLPMHFLNSDTSLLICMFDFLFF